MFKKILFGSLLQTINPNNRTLNNMPRNFIAGSALGLGCYIGYNYVGFYGFKSILFGLDKLYEFKYEKQLEEKIQK